MTALDDDETLWVDLMLGYEIAEGVRADIHTRQFETAYDDLRHMREIVDRTRAQILSIIEGLRAWKRRHGDLRHPRKLRYSAIEGVLIRHYLRQHWILYRRANRECLALFRECHDRIPLTQPRSRKRAA